MDAKATYNQTVHVDTLWQQHNNNEVTGRIESHRLISGLAMISMLIIPLVRDTP